MTKRIIAFMLSVVMSVSSVGTMPGLAAETISPGEVSQENTEGTTQESSLIVDETESDQELGENESESDLFHTG